ncbi:hypothetical protein BBF96_03360 [Anoxybacter fermentans]|uniref:Uncharacterized protein n=1 Tax=Anoxybacter fermentans TaxID=1323375 RepID=A0A3Q9HP64_9FIRM|nr:DUF3820 family protein [Anoxybacter fermentans]AZR72503.1 hypothetical protein BBF96_03360 [Anoxybacter fermentans]
MGSNVPAVESNILPPNLEESIKNQKLQNKALMRLMRELLEEGVDYGKVKGVKRPFLHQPGAQQLGLVFKLAPKFIKIDSIFDFEREPVFMSYEFKCELYHRETGMFLGDGVGAANNYEKKYRYLKDGTEVRDPLDKQNTIMKMAKKRAFVDAVLNVTGASRLFATEDDLEEFFTDIGTDPGKIKMPFGKHKGKRLEELDTDYLQWVIGKADKEELREAAKAVLERRLREEETTKQSDQGKITEETLSNLRSCINSTDEKIRTESRKIAQVWLIEHGFTSLTDIRNLTEEQGKELCQMILETFSTDDNKQGE